MAHRGGIRGRTCCGGCCQDRHSAASCGGLVGRGLGDALRAFGTEVLICPRCGGRRKVLTAIHDPESIRKVLGAIGLSAEVPVFLPARSPPRQGELEFGG